MRLTNNHGEVVACGNNCKYNYEHCHDNNCPSLNEVYEKLAEYEKLEEEGKLLKLPVAPGDTIYIVKHEWSRCSHYERAFDDYSCEGCELELDEWCDSHKVYYVDSIKIELADIVRYMDKNLFGDTVFASEEEAEERCEYLNKKH